MTSSFPEQSAHFLTVPRHCPDAITWRLFSKTGWCQVWEQEIPKTWLGALSQQQAESWNDSSIRAGPTMLGLTLWDWAQNSSSLSSQFKWNPNWESKRDSLRGQLGEPVAGVAFQRARPAFSPGPYFFPGCQHSSCLASDHFLSFRTAYTKKTSSNKYWWGYGETEILVCYWGLRSGHETGEPLRKRVCSHFRVSRAQCPNDPEIPLRGTKYKKTKELIHRLY